MGTKGKEFLADAEAAGWEGSVRQEGNQEHCDISIEVEGRTTRLHMVWDGQKYNDKDSFRTTPEGQRRAVRNASAARKLLGEVSGAEVAARPRTVPSRPPADTELPPDRPPVRPPAKKLPFKISSSDRDICEAVLGKEIFWWSNTSRSVQSARVMSDPRQRHLKVISAHGKRALHWAAYRDGFRAVHLENIIEVRA